jgi:hypothetical protein
MNQKATEISKEVPERFVHLSGLAALDLRHCQLGAF